jgi:hypothetical protein
MADVSRIREYGIYMTYYDGGYGLRTWVSIIDPYYRRVCLFKLED